MRILTLADFSSRLGKAFDVLVQGGSVALTLAAAQELPGGRRQGGGFRLEFTGRADQMLQQGTFAMQNGGERFDIFIVPIGGDPRGVRYEAIFY